MFGRVKAVATSLASALQRPFMSGQGLWQGLQGLLMLLVVQLELWFLAPKSGI